MLTAEAFRSWILRGRDRLRVPGLVGILFADGHEVTRVETGRDVARRRAPLTLDHRFPLGSCTKLFTGTLARGLERAGVLDLQTPLERALAELAADGRSPYGDVRLEELLHHRSGLPDRYLDEPDLLAWMRALTGSPRAQRATCSARILGWTPSHPPGREFLYANLNYVLLAHAIEERLDRDVEDLLRERILHPLGLASADFGWPHPDHAACGHRSRPLIRGLSLHVQKPQALADTAPRPVCLRPSGGISMSPRDLARFLMHHQTALAGGEGPLDPAVVRVVHRACDKYASGANAEVRAGERVSWHLGRVGNHYIEYRLVVDRGWGFVMAGNSSSIWKTARAYGLEILEAGLAAGAAP